MRRAAKVDQNQPEIVRAFRRFGFSVRSLAMVGDGFPDLIVARLGKTALVEVKRPKGRLTDGQEKFIRDWRGQVFVVRSIDDVLDVYHALR